jgi:mannosyltransferase OCH1-like enzyme
MILIPKTLHYVWLGRGQMHPLMLGWREKWAALHPGWEVKIWAEVEDLPPHLLACGDSLVECRHPSYLVSCPTHAKRSDVWRYEILEQLGGVYLDTDMEPVKCIEPLLDGAECFAGLCLTSYRWKDGAPGAAASVEVGCSIMGARAHHPWLRELVALTPGQDPQAQISLAFPFVTEVTGRHPEVRLLAPETFYPQTWDRYVKGGYAPLKDEALSENTHAVHRWSSTWFAEGLTPRG